MGLHRGRWLVQADPQLRRREAHHATALLGGLDSLLGPILGVTCTVWAQQTLPAGQVQLIAAMAPMISVPFAFWLNGHRPPRLSYLGAAVAIVGLVLVDLNT